jgi:glycosyltransferase involved in cell wall biosynthesis
MEGSSNRIVLVTDMPLLSGIGVYVTQLYSLMRSDFPGLQIRNIHYFRDPMESAVPSIPGQQFSSTRMGAYFALRQNEKLLAHEPDSDDSLYHLCGASYRLAKHVKRSIATVHDFGIRDIRSLLTMHPSLAIVEAYSMVNWLQLPKQLACCQNVVSISDLTQERLRRIAAIRSQVIHHWVDSDRFRRRDMQASRIALQLPPDRRLLLNVSAGTSNKNLGFLKKVLSALPPNFLLVKIGFPIRGLSGRVVNRGTVTESDYPLYFNAADTYVHPSLSEGFGRPLIEALASGTPIVALANSPAPEIIGRSGILVPPTATPRTFAENVVTTADSDSRSSELLHRGLVRAGQFNATTARGLYREVYLNALRR